MWRIDWWLTNWLTWCVCELVLFVLICAAVCEILLFYANLKKVFCVKNQGSNSSHPRISSFLISIIWLKYTHKFCNYSRIYTHAYTVLTYNFYKYSLKLNKREVNVERVKLLYLNGGQSERLFRLCVFWVVCGRGEKRVCRDRAEVKDSLFK